jgi:hypothetical protein
MATQEPTGKPGAIEFYGGYQVYSESGVDLTLLRENLRRSLEERWENNRRALAFSHALREAVRGSSGTRNNAGEGSPMTDAVAVIRQLTSHQVEFVVVGGQAMRAHGSAHVTEDVDVCYRRSPANIAALAAAMAPLHPYLRGAPRGLPFRFDPPTIQSGLNFTLTTDVGDIDFLGEVSGLGDYEAVLAHSSEHEFLGAKVRILSVDGLIAAKRAAGRGKDQHHLLELEELKKLRDNPP